jgi:hypothetical protein
VIDKLDLRIPGHNFFTPDVARFIREIDYTGGNPRTKRSPFYAGIADLRPVGIDAFLHVHYRFREPHDNKLEILDVWKKPYSELVQLIQAVTPVDADELGIMRLDLCADVPNVPVIWFQPRARFEFKRYAREDGELKYAKVGKEGVQTLTAGRRPNLYRIYDKPAECRFQFRRLLRKRPADSPELDFEHEFGFPPDAVITRIERQMGSRDVAEVPTFADVPRLPDFNPFERLQIIGGEKCTQPTLKEDGFSNWVFGTRLAELADEMGMQQFRRWLNINCNGNASRTLKKYARYFAGAGEGISAQRIYEIYRESTRGQLAA